MPEPKDYDNQEEWLNACIPKLISEGEPASTAVNVCEVMWAKRGDEKKKDEPEMAYIGSPVKALGDGKIGGYLVRFSSEDDPDLMGEFFTTGTEFGTNHTPPLMYHHGFDKQLKTRIIGTGEWKQDEIGLWYEAQLNERDEYEKRIYSLVEQGKLGYSSGAVSHLVEIVPGKTASWIKTWVIGEASLTPTPAEPRNHVIPIKTFYETIQDILPEPEPIKEQPNEPEAIQPILEPTEQEQKTMTDQVQLNEDQIKAMIDQSVETALKSLPAEKSESNVKVIADPADRPWEKPGDFFKAVKNAAFFPQEIDPRLAKAKALGLNEGVPAEGGYLVPVTTSNQIMDQMLNTGEILSRISLDPVIGNTMLYNGIDTTTRVGSLYGGIIAYWLAEAAAKTASKPAFWQMELKLKKIAALVYATDEQLEDTPNLESWLLRTVPNVLRFYVEDAIVEGDGIGKPLGIMNSPALITILRETGGSITVGDIAGMWARRWAGTSDYVWLINTGATAALNSLVVGTTAVYMPPGGISAAPHATLYGRPVIETEYAQALGTTGDILLASLSQYQAINKGGVKTDTSIHVAFLTDETAFRFVYRIDGAPMWNSDMTPLHGATVSPFVTLNSATA